MVRKCLLGVLTLLLGAILPPTAAGRGGVFSRWHWKAPVCCPWRWSLMETSGTAEQKAWPANLVTNQISGSQSRLGNIYWHFPSGMGWTEAPVLFTPALSTLSHVIYPWLLRGGCECGSRGLWAASIFRATSWESNLIWLYCILLRMQIHSSLYFLSNYDGVNSNTYSILKVRAEVHLHRPLQSELIDSKSQGIAFSGKWSSVFLMLWHLRPENEWKKNDSPIKTLVLLSERTCSVH